MEEPNKFGPETEVADTVPKPNAGEGNLKRGNEKGVGTEFTEKYNQVLESVIKQKFPDYIDPSTMSIDFNDTRSVEKFNEMSQMKQEILKIVDEKLRNAPPLNLKSGLELFDKKTNAGTIKTEEFKQAKTDARNPKFWDKIQDGRSDKNEITSQDELIEGDRKTILDKIFNHLPEYSSSPAIKIFLDKISKGKEAFIENKKVIKLIQADPRFETHTEPNGRLYVKSFDHTQEPIQKNAGKAKQKKERKDSLNNNKVNLLFDVGGGPQAGEILNVSENGKVFQYHIIKNDGKNMEFKIGEDGLPQIIGLRQAKEFLSKPGIDFTYEEKSEDEKDSSEATETLNSQGQEGIETKLKLEIDELEKEILELEALKQKMEQEAKDNEVNTTLENPKEDNTNDNGVNHEENTDKKQSNSIEIATESMSIKNFEKEIDGIIINSLGKELEANGLDYENTAVSYKDGNVHTEIQFNHKKIILSFDLMSQNNVAVLKNEKWAQSSLYKITTLNKLTEKNAKQWSNIILNKFVKKVTNEEKFRKIDIKDGELKIEHAI